MWQHLIFVEYHQLNWNWINKDYFSRAKEKIVFIRTTYREIESHSMTTATLSTYFFVFIGCSSRLCMWRYWTSTFIIIFARVLWAIMEFESNRVIVVRIIYTTWIQTLATTHIELACFHMVKFHHKSASFTVFRYTFFCFQCSTLSTSA